MRVLAAQTKYYTVPAGFGPCHLLWGICGRCFVETAAAEVTAELPGESGRENRFFFMKPNGKSVQSQEVP